MNEETTTETTTPKRQLLRKALILTGAAVGIFIAGGFVLGRESDDEELESEELVLDDLAETGVTTE